MKRSMLVIITVLILVTACTAAPTPTPVPPTLAPTPIPPTATSVPPTATPVPPTATPVPPTATPVPPTATALPPTRTPVPPTSTPAPFALSGTGFEADYKGDCTDVDVAITEVTGTSLKIKVLNGSLAIRGGKLTVWCYGAKHTWQGTLTYAGYTFASDAATPMQFTLDKDKGYIYVTGKGSVTFPDGKIVQFPK